MARIHRRSAGTWEVVVELKAADSTLDYQRIEERLERRRQHNEAPVMLWMEPSHAIAPEVPLLADRLDFAEDLSPDIDGPSPFQ